MKTYTLTEIAKLIRAALKEAFPKTKFSVKSERYSGGNSITAYWTDGPTTSQVDPILNSFAGADFDGMTDCKMYRGDRLFKGEIVNFRVDFVFASRSESFNTVKAAAFRVAEECDLPLMKVEPQGHVSYGPMVPFGFRNDVFFTDHNGRGEAMDQLIHQVARATSFETGNAVELPVMPLASNVVVMQKRA
jgi:hypothetical protein